MSVDSNPLCYLEIGEFSLRIARFRAVGEMAKIRTLQEVWYHDEENFPAFIHDLTTSLGGKGDAIHASVYSGERFFRLLNPEQVAELQSGDEALQFLEDKLPASAASAAYFFLDTSTGGALHFGSDNASGLVAAVTASSLEETKEFCAANGLGAVDLQMASTRQLGALQSFLKLQKPDSPIIHLEIGEKHSHLHILGADGLDMVTSIPFALDCIIDGIQEELGMKYRGSAVKLLFLGEYDFSDIAEQLATPLAQGVAAQLEAFVNNGGVAPEQMVVSGLPQKQSWISATLGSILDMSPLQIDMFSWLESNSVMLEETAFDQDISPSWIGFFQRIGQIARAEKPETIAWASPLIDEPIVARMPKPVAAAVAAAETPAPSPGESISSTQPSAVPQAAPTPFWKTPAGYGSIAGGVLVLIFVLWLVLGGDAPPPSEVRPTMTGTATRAIAETAPERTHAPQPNRIFSELPPLGQRGTLAFDAGGRLVWENVFHQRENFQRGPLQGQNDWRASPDVELRDIASAADSAAYIPGSTRPNHVERFFNIPGEVIRITVEMALQRGTPPNPNTLQDPSAVLVTVNQDGFLVGYDGFSGDWVTSSVYLPDDGASRTYEFLLNYETQIWTLLLDGDLVFSRFGFRDTSLNQLMRIRLQGSENSGTPPTKLKQITILPPDERGVIRR